MLQTMCLLGWCLFILLRAGVNAGVAPFIVPCKWDDSSCLLASAQKVLPMIVAGIPELGVPSANPLIVGNVKGDGGDLNLSFIDLKVEGLNKCQIQKLDRDIKASTISVVADCPYRGIAKYEVSGKFFGIPVEGNGDFQLSGGELQLSVTLKIDSATGKDEKKHWKIVNREYSYDPKGKFSFVLTNLSNGDEEKAKPILQILNTEWQKVISTLGKPTINKVIDKVIDVVASFFNAVPIDELELA